MTAGSPATLEWFGCTTFRLRFPSVGGVGGLTLFLDTYMDRPPGLPPVGLTTAEVEEADFVLVSHAHFDHILGADTIALRTGATVVGSYESIRVLREAGVPEAQLLPVSGGEKVDCGGGVQVRVFPSIHSCLHAARSDDTGGECLGDLGVSIQAQREHVAAVLAALRNPDVVTAPVAEWVAGTDGRVSDHDGGQLVYLIESPEGTLLFSASAGCWMPILRELRADVAILAAAGRPNLDGEPFQGSTAEFLVRQIEVVRPSTVVFCHHDALLPPVVGATDVAAARAAIETRTPARVVDLAYGEVVEPFGVA